jgi:hypothetical protein
VIASVATAVYLLCALASASCAILLGRMYWRNRARVRPLVAWSSASFAAFAVSNALVVIDLAILGSPRLLIARAGTACLASAVLLFGLIQDTE